MGLRSDFIAVVTRETRMEGLVARWGTRGAAKFRFKMARQHEAEQQAAPSPAAQAKNVAQAAAVAERDFNYFVQEHDTYEQTLAKLRSELDLGLPLAWVDRAYLPTFDFRGCPAVVVVGQDGLVANVAKYVGDVPVVAVNPDPRAIDGVLLPFRADQARHALQRLLDGKAKLRQVTLAEATLNDGQRLLAFNDLFIGQAGHASARYTLKIGNASEPQSSSGVIVSTGAGSTGWLSSLFNMHAGMGRWLGSEESESLVLPWEDPRLVWVVREPFRSKQSSANLVAGMLENDQELVIESLMSERGVIFSDGIEADFLEFNSGVSARIRRAPQCAQLVVE